jgi:HK97 family phage major capsid protein
MNAITPSSMRQLLARRADIKGQMDALDLANPNGALAEAEQRQWDDCKNQMADVDAAIERRVVRDDAERKMRGTPIAGGGDNRWAELLAGYSLSRACLYNSPEQVDCGREREASKEIERRTGRSARGLIIPDEVFRVRQTTIEVRAGGQIVGDPTLGGVLDPDRYRGDQYTDRLRAASVLPRLGVQVLDGLQGATVIPKLTQSGSVQWVAENNSPTESEALFTSITLTPHTAAAAMGYSRRTLINATPSIDALLRDDMARQLATALDTGALFGAGGTEPLGLLNYAGPGVPTLPTLPSAPVSVENLIDLMALPQAANGMTGGPAWVANMKTIAAAMKVKTSGSGDYVLLPTLPGVLLGFPVVISSVIPSEVHVSVGTTDNPIIFGSWASMVVGRWSGIDILADPYTRGASGAVRLYAFLDVDVGIRHIESFAAMLVIV